MADMQDTLVLSSDKIMQQLPELVTEYGLKLLLAIVIFALGRWLSSLAKAMTHKVLTRRNIDQTVVSFIANMMWATVFAFTVIATLGQLGVHTASLVAAVGAAGLAIGLALQGSLSNFAAGVLIILLRPCRVGDYIVAAGVSGTVDEITIFSTRLLTSDHKVVTVPNSAIMHGSITNYSAMPSRRIDLVIGVSYDADVREVKALLSQLLEQNQYVLEEPAFTVAVYELADSSVNFVVRPWVNTPDYWPAYYELLESIKLGLDEAGIGIPYPQMDVHFPAGEKSPSPEQDSPEVK
ncbi:mechanosensitive ion channel protein [Shewanella sp. NFH-SH190041]|uniref:mechanosensitive ion channel family protein n=1 Tax=Shewanella sp. NFH-SH190041 TaxID=2950245 RepID=UPI0021C32D37|nr:mechanosensitive ion channel domain-containing protein [Shewanella sp. NFH-SH190041]BDM65265.1 mechanosensitive ion channel protein [Shewanella sp. NFH-SH190041]